MTVRRTTDPQARARECREQAKRTRGAYRRLWLRTAEAWEKLAEREQKQEITASNSPAVEPEREIQ